MDPLYLPPTQPRPFPAASSLLPPRVGGRGEQPGRGPGRMMEAPGKGEADSMISDPKAVLA